MRNNKNYSFVLLLSFLTLHILHSTSCTLECGGIQIPFPFGIGGPGCYLDEWYKIECQKNAETGKDFPFLVKMQMEVLNISLPVAGYDMFSFNPKFSSVRVKSPITSLGCSGDGKESRLALNLTDSPYFFVKENSLVAVGCNTKASLTNVEPKMVGCESTCTTTTSNSVRTIPFFDRIGCRRPPNYYRGSLPPYYVPVCNLTREEQDETICNGNGCCQANAPEGAQQIIGVTITSSDTGNLTTEGDCKVAFLTDEVYTLSNVTTPENLFAKGYATVTLGWFIRTSNASFLPSLGCQNKEDYYATDFDKRIAKCTCDNHTVSGISYGSCACSPGCLGNPYSVGDCTEINMCLADPCDRFKICKHSSAGRHCVNLHIPEILTGLSAGLFVLILVFGTLWLRKFRRRRRISKSKRNFFKRNGGLLLQQQLNTTQGNVEKTKIFSSKELEKATDDFNVDRVIGQGGLLKLNLILGYA